MTNFICSTGHVHHSDIWWNTNAQTTHMIAVHPIQFVKIQWVHTIALARVDLLGMA